jgi:hypothetical protein
VQEEYDLKVFELQHDLKSLQGQLDEQYNTQRQAEKEKSLLITTLSEQNQRLTTQLKEVSYSVGFFFLKCIFIFRNVCFPFSEH